MSVADHTERLGASERALADLVTALAAIRPASLDPANRAALAQARAAAARLVEVSGAGSAGPCPERMPALEGHGVLLAAPSAPAEWAAALRAAGARVFSAPTGAAAMGWLELSPCDLALVDPRIGGAEQLVAAIRAQGGAPGRVPVLALGPLPGADALLAPNASAEALAATLAAVLDRRGAELTQMETLDQAVDPERFDRLMDMAGPDAAQELLERLEEDLVCVARGLSHALEGEAIAPSELRAQTHVLIALAGAVGAEPLQRLAEALNAAAHRGSVAEMRRLGAATQVRLANLVQFLAARHPGRVHGPSGVIGA
ncbi:MAG: hypothetical protein ACXIUV_06175 [Alkalilacustris sp.]